MPTKDIDMLHNCNKKAYINYICVLNTTIVRRNNGFYNYQNDYVCTSYISSDQKWSQ